MCCENFLFLQQRQQEKKRKCSKYIVFFTVSVHKGLKYRLILKSLLWGPKGVYELWWFCFKYSMFNSRTGIQDVRTSVPGPLYSRVNKWNVNHFMSPRTFCSKDHLSIYCRGYDGLWEILQVPAQTVAQNWKFQRIEVCRGSIWGAKQHGDRNKYRITFLHSENKSLLQSTYCTTFKASHTFSSSPLASVFVLSIVFPALVPLAPLMNSQVLHIQILTAIKILSDFKSSTSSKGPIQRGVVET